MTARTQITRLPSTCAGKGRNAGGEDHVESSLGDDRVADAADDELGASAAHHSGCPTDDMLEVGGMNIGPSARLVWVVAAHRCASWRRR
jgi:hypothetical protein